MIKHLAKKFLLSVRLQYRYYAVTQAFNERYAKVSPILFENSLSSQVIKEYKKKWGVFGKKVEIETLLLCYNLSGVLDLNIVPENIFAVVIEPTLNGYKDKELSFIPIKNFYEKWFSDSKVFPKSYFHKVDNIYYDSQFRVINDIQEFLMNSAFDYPLICKPSLASGGGVGVRTINSIDEVMQALGSYSSLIFQEKIEQHDSLDKVNPRMNTVRTCLYRTADGNFEVLNNSIRFGVNGSLDNLKDGGVACYVDEQGRLNSYAVEMYCKRHNCHPNSNVLFAEVVIPYYKSLQDAAVAIANEIPLCNLVSLDMCLDKNNNWRCIEINLTSQTIRFAQYAGHGFFGKYTDEVIQKVLSQNENCNS